MYASPGVDAVKLLGTIALVVIAVFVGLFLLRWLAGLLLGAFIPLLILTVGIAIGIWIAGRRRGAEDEGPA